MPRYRGCILDLDGTVYLGDRLIPGADNAVRRLRAMGVRVAFITNKTVQNRADYAAKLARLGIPADPSDVVTAAEALLARLAAEAPGARLYVIGEPPLARALEAAGFRLCCDEDAVDYVVVSLDRTLHVGKLNFALRALRRGARLCAANPDATCPYDSGEVMDAGATLAALQAMTGIRPAFIAGKPSPLLLETTLARLGLSPSECVLVGDRLETDIAMARAAGLAGALVLTGVTSRAQVDNSSLRPDYVLDSIAEVPRIA